MFFDSLLLNIITVFISSIATPFVISKILSKPLSKPAAAAVVGINSIVWICIWIAVREVVGPKSPLPGLESTPGYILYGIGLSLLAGWSMLTGKKSAQ